MAEFSNPVTNPNSKATLKDLLVKRKSERQNQKVVGDNLEAINPVGGWQLTKLNTEFKMPKALTEREVKQIFQPFGTVAMPIGTPHKVTVDPRYSKGASNFITNALTYTRVPPDSGMYSWIGSHVQGEALDGDPEVVAVRRALDDIDNWIVTNGPSEGLYARIQQGLKVERPVIKVDEAKFIPALLKSFGFDKSKFITMAGQPPEFFLDVEVNFNASSGYPRQELKGVVINELYEDAIELFNIISEGNLLKHMSEEPEWYLVALKNKLDRIRKKDTSFKVRPYYVFPGHLCLLWSMVIQNISACFSPFTEGRGNLGIGFSWNYGGGQKLYEWIAKPRKDLTFDWLAYADDGLYVYTYGGKTYVFTPDVKHMDMSLGPQIGELFFKAIVSELGDELGPNWKKVLQLNAVMAFKSSIAVGGSIVYYIKEMLKSGVPGTSYYDQVASALIGTQLAPQYIGQPPAKFIANLAEGLKKRYGWEFKEETLKVYEFIPDQDEYDFVFLGQTLKRVKGSTRKEYIPKTPLENVVRGLTLPRRTYSSTVQRESAYMERYRGVIASGGVFYPRLYEYVKMKYDVNLSAGMVPKDEAVEENALVSLPFTGPGFPTLEWIYNLYLQPDNAITIANPLSESPTEAQTNVYVLDDMFSDIKIIDDKDEDEDIESESDEEEEVYSAESGSDSGYVSTDSYHDDWIPDPIPEVKKPPPLPPKAPRQLAQPAVKTDVQKAAEDATEYLKFVKKEGDIGFKIAQQLLQFSDTQIETFKTLSITKAVNAERKDINRSLHFLLGIGVLTHPENSSVWKFTDVGKLLFSHMKDKKLIPLLNEKTKTKEEKPTKLKTKLRKSTGAWGDEFSDATVMEDGYKSKIHVPTRVKSQYQGRKVTQYD